MSEMPNTPLTNDAQRVDDRTEAVQSGFKLTVALRVISGLSCMALLAIGVGVASLYFINQIDKTLNNITDVSAPTVETADDLISGLWQSAKIAQEVKAEEDLARVDTLIADFKRIGVKFETDYVELTTLVKDRDLLDELERVKTEYDDFKRHAEMVFVARIEEIEEKRAAVQYLEEFDAIGARLITMLDEFANENEEEMARAEDRGDELQRSGASGAEVNALLGELFEKDYPVVEAALKMQRLVIEMQDTAGEYMAEGNLEKLSVPRQEFSDLAAQATDFISVLTDLAETSEDTQDAADLLANFNDWVEGADKDEALFDTHRDMLNAEQRADTASKLFADDADIVASSLAVIADKADAKSDAADDIAAEVVHQANMAVLVAFAAVIMLAGGLIYMVLTKVTRPITSMTQAMRRLAEKDMSVDVPGVGRVDEIGGMADAVQVFKDNMIRADELAEQQRLSDERQRQEEERQRVRAKKIDELAEEFDSSVSNTLGVVSSAAKQMGNAAESLSATATQTQEQSSTVAAASEEASTNVQTVAAATGELTSSISEISRQAAQSADVSTRAVSELQSTNDEIGKLAEAADRIGEIVKLITDIAEQTNLLALNATIEAARAGDAGKGFAVVASEVKNLANQTAKGTEDISKQINGLQSLTRTAVSSVNGIGDTMEQINEIATAISSAVEQQTSATQEISINIEQAATGTSEVSTNIVEVNAAATETGNAASQVLSSTESLNQETTVLRDVVEKFLSDIKAA